MLVLTNFLVQPNIHVCFKVIYQSVYLKCLKQIDNRECLMIRKCILVQVYPKWQKW